MYKIAATFRRTGNPTSVLTSFALLLAVCCSANGQSSNIGLDFTGESLNAFQASLTLGWSFHVSEPIRIDGLGFFDHFESDEDGLMQDHLIRIWTDQMEPDQLAETVITNASDPTASMAENGRWLFNNIDPIVLIPGDYIIGADDPFCSGSDCDRYRFIVNAITMPEITFLEARSASPPGPPRSPQPNLNAGYFGPTFRAIPLGILLGDVNGDGNVNLLDVAPFVELLIHGMFLPAGDINGDGIVDLLDVNPFIALLIE